MSKHQNKFTRIKTFWYYKQQKKKLLLNLKDIMSEGYLMAPSIDFFLNNTFHQH